MSKITNIQKKYISFSLRREEDYTKLSAIIYHSSEQFLYPIWDDARTYLISLESEKRAEMVKTFEKL